MSAAFTPGPWQAKHDYTVEGATTIIANVDGESFSDGTTSHTFDFIAICEDEYGERLLNAQANARLIAAAPEMFAALELALANVECVEGDKCPHWVEWHNVARAALAKARGEQS